MLKCNIIDIKVNAQKTKYHILRSSVGVALYNLIDNHNETIGSKSFENETKLKYPLYVYLSECLCD
jgi:hypothetical protein